MSLRGVVPDTGRWLFLARSLWVELLFDGCTRLQVSEGALARFLDVLQWRASGRITEMDFVSLFRRWRARVESSGAFVEPVVGEARFCEILLERESKGKGLDIMFGLLVYESNRILLEESRGSLTPAWIAAAEDAFFLLDGPGFGHISFDQVCLLCACRARLSSQPLALKLRSVLVGLRAPAGLVGGLVTLRNFKRYLGLEKYDVGALRELCDAIRDEQHRRGGLLGGIGGGGDTTGGLLWPRAVGGPGLNCVATWSTLLPLPVDVFLLLHGPPLRCQVWLAFESELRQQQGEGGSSDPDDELANRQAAAIWTAFSSQPGLADAPVAVESLVADPRVLAIFSALSSLRKLEQTLALPPMLPLSRGQGRREAHPEVDGLSSSSSLLPSLSSLAAAGNDRSCVPTVRSSSVLRSPWSGEAMDALVKDACWVDVTLEMATRPYTTTTSSEGAPHAIAIAIADASVSESNATRSWDREEPSPFHARIRHPPHPAATTTTRTDRVEPGSDNVGRDHFENELQPHPRDTAVMRQAKGLRRALRAMHLAWVPVSASPTAPAAANEALSEALKEALSIT